MKNRSYRRFVTLATVTLAPTLFLMSSSVSCSGSSGGSAGNSTLTSPVNAPCNGCHIMRTIIHTQTQLGCSDCHGANQNNNIVPGHFAPNQLPLFRSNLTSQIVGGGVAQGTFFNPEFFDAQFLTTAAGTAGQDVGVDFNLDGIINPFDPMGTALVSSATAEQSSGQPMVTFPILTPAGAVGVSVFGNNNPQGNGAAIVEFQQERDDIAGEFVDGEYNEDLNWVRWRNPSDLRVAQASCGRMSPRAAYIGRCHQAEVDSLRQSIMTTASSFNNGAYYFNRGIPAVSPQDGRGLDPSLRQGYFGYVLDYATADANFNPAINGWPPNSVMNKIFDGQIMDNLAAGPGINPDGVRNTTDFSVVAAGFPKTNRLPSSSRRIRDTSRTLDVLDSPPDRVIAEGNPAFATTLANLLNGNQGGLDQTLQMNRGDVTTTGDGIDITSNVIDSLVRGFRPYYSLIIPANARDSAGSPGLRVKDTTISAFLSAGVPFELIGQNNPVGTFNASGCAACHVLYARSGVQSGEASDLNIQGNGRQPSLALPLGFQDAAGQAPHGIQHFLTTQITADQCENCHTFTSRSNLVFGGRAEIESGFDQNQQSYVQTFRTPNGTRVRMFSNLANFLFDGVNRVLVNAGAGGSEDTNNNGELDPGEDTNANGLLDIPDVVPRGISSDGRQQRFVYGGANGSIRLQDVHLERGMMCVDCHFLQDNHGDGNIYSRSWDAVEIECEDCHGTGSQKATLITSGPNGGNDLTQYFDKGTSLTTGLGAPFFSRLSDGTIIQRSRVNPNLTFRPTQVIDTVTPGNPDFNPRSAGVKGIASGSFPGVNAHVREIGQVVGGSGGLECYACHNAFTMNCVSCHYNQRYRAIDLAGLNPAGQNAAGGAIADRQRGTYLDTKLRPGFSEFQAFGFVRAPFILGRNSTSEFSRISTYRSMMQVHQSISADIPNFGTATGMGLIGDDTVLHNSSTATPNNLAGGSLQAFMPHTIRSRETRDCDQCHTGMLRLASLTPLVLASARAPISFAANPGDIQFIINNQLTAQTYGLGGGRYTRLLDWAFIGTGAGTQILDIKREVQNQTNKVFPGFVGLTGGGLSDGTGPGPFNPNGAMDPTGGPGAMFPNQPAPRSVTAGPAATDVRVFRNVSVPTSAPVTGTDIAIVANGTSLTALQVTGRDNPNVPTTFPNGTPTVSVGTTISAIDSLGQDMSIGYPDASGGPLIYVATQTGLTIVEITAAAFNTATLTVRGTITVDANNNPIGPVADVVAAGRLVYLLTASNPANILAIDVSNKFNPVDVTGTDVTTGARPQIPSLGRALGLYNLLLYVITDQGLDVFIANHDVDGRVAPPGGGSGLGVDFKRETIQGVSTFSGVNMTPDFRSIAFYDNRAVIAGGVEGVYVIDITPSAAPGLLFSRLFSTFTAPPAGNAAANPALQQTPGPRVVTFGGGAVATDVVMHNDPGPAGSTYAMVLINNPGTIAGVGTPASIMLGFDLTDFRDWRQRIVSFAAGAPGSNADDALFATLHQAMQVRRDPLSVSSPFNNQPGFMNAGGIVGLNVLASSVGMNPNPSVNANIFFRAGPTVFIGQTVYIWPLGAAATRIAPGVVSDRLVSETGDPLRDTLDPGAGGLAFDQVTRLRSVRVTIDPNLLADPRNDISGNGLPQVFAVDVVPPGF